MKRRLILCCMAFVLTACNANSQTSAQSSVSMEVASQQAILLDVRTPEEYASGHVKTAILAPHDTIAQTIATIAPDKQQKIYLHCRSGRRSAIAAQTLKDLGYRQIVNLGGLGDLGKYGLKIDAP